MTILSKDELERGLEGAPGWKVEGKELIQTFQFQDFVEAMRFVDKAAALAEELGHHPDIDIRYNRVKLGLTTHDAGGLTSLDLAFATRVTTFLTR